MSNAISGKESDNTNSSTEINNTEEETNPESNTPDDNSRSIKEPVKEETKDTEEVIVPEIIDKAVEEVNKNELLVPTAVADSDIAQTKAKKKSTLSKVGKGLASIIASI